MGSFICFDLMVFLSGNVIGYVLLLNSIDYIRTGRGVVLRYVVSLVGDGFLWDRADAKGLMRRICGYHVDHLINLWAGCGLLIFE